MSVRLLTPEDRPDMRLPDFIVPGVMKSGTTSLHFYLCQHPDIWMPQGKWQETHFFDYDENYNQGLDWYKDRLKGWTSEKLLGQTCPNYLGNAKAITRMEELLPSVKFIIVMRNPVDRAFSHYWHEVKKNREKESFEQALILEEERISKNEIWWRYYCYRLRGKYYEHVLDLIKTFPNSDIHFVVYENLRVNPLLEINKCFQFLGLQPLTQLKFEIHNKTVIPRSFFVKKLINSPKLDWLPLVSNLRSLEFQHNRIHQYGKMNDATRNELLTYYRDSNKQLSDLIGVDLSIWEK